MLNKPKNKTSLYIKMLIDPNNIATQLQTIYLSPSGKGTVLITLKFAAATETFPIPIVRGNTPYAKLLQKVMYLTRLYVSNCRKVTVSFADKSSLYDSSLYIFDGLSLNQAKYAMQIKSFNKYLVAESLNGSAVSL
jgi:hypothetical protein